MIGCESPVSQLQVIQYQTHKTTLHVHYVALKMYVHLHTGPPSFCRLLMANLKKIFALLRQTL